MTRTSHVFGDGVYKRMARISSELRLGLLDEALRLYHDEGA